VRWTVLIPAKALPAAKSRLRAASASGTAHDALVRAIRADTYAAAAAAGSVARAVLVLDHDDDEDSARIVFTQSRPGLNAGLAEAADYAARRWPTDAIAALVADLPALRAEELDAALAAAVAHPRSYVPDRQGTGTTLLTAVPGQPLRPAFGPGSAARHRAGAVRLDAGPGLRCDVDSPADLRAALSLGVGTATSDSLAAARRLA
jgi:2-phospho-L-lactate guanylyltransferase